MTLATERWQEKMRYAADTDIIPPARQAGSGRFLDRDSSLTARKELAKELNYTGDTNDSAAMNVWLHKQVMRKLAENGGKVPDDLKD